MEETQKEAFLDQFALRKISFSEVEKMDVSFNLSLQPEVQPGIVVTPKVEPSDVSPESVATEQSPDENKKQVCHMGTQTEELVSRGKWAGKNYFKNKNKKRRRGCRGHGRKLRRELNRKCQGQSVKREPLMAVPF